MLSRILRPLAVAIVLAGAIGGALALNIDQNRVFPARIHPSQQVHYYRVAVNYNDPNISTAQQFGTLPALASIINVQVDVVTAFNAGTTNVLTIGTTTTANEIVAAADVNEGATGVTQVTRGYGRSLTASADTALYAKYTQSGTAASAGQAIVTIAYIPNNDM